MCLTPAGGELSDSGSEPQSGDGMLPLTNADDPSNIQDLDPLDPAAGVPVTVDANSHWRMYVVYTDTIDPKLAVTRMGRCSGCGA